MGYPTNPIPRPSPRQRGQAERSEALTGDRAPEHKALTVNDAAQLGEVRLLSVRVSAAPTMEQHNALVEDIHALATILNRLGAKISGF